MQVCSSGPLYANCAHRHVLPHPVDSLVHEHLGFADGGLHFSSKILDLDKSVESSGIKDKNTVVYINPEVTYAPTVADWPHVDRVNAKLTLLLNGATAGQAPLAAGGAACCTAV